jgi:hypothetical protein
MAEPKAKEDSSHLLLLADIVIQATPVTDAFKTTALGAIYEKCQKDGAFYSDIVPKNDYRERK